MHWIVNTVHKRCILSSYNTLPLVHQRTRTTLTKKPSVVETIDAIASSAETKDAGCVGVRTPIHTTTLSSLTSRATIKRSTTSAITYIAAVTALSTIFAARLTSALIIPTPLQPVVGFSPHNAPLLLYRPTWVRRLIATATASIWTIPQPARTLTTTTTRRNMSSLSTTLRDNHGTITVTPKTETDQSALIVIAHGLGDSAEGFVDVAEHFAKEMPHVKFILPTAPSNPVTMNMGMAMPSWYDITGLDERSNENCNGLERSVSTITDILLNEQNTTGLPFSRMILAGFSQGGALSLFTGFQLTEPIAGIVCMSGYLPAAKKFRITAGNEHIPVLHCHGTQDMMVAYPLAQKSKTKVQEAGCTSYTIRSYPVAHTVDTKELADVLAFLKERLPPDTTYNIKVKEVKDMSVKELREAIRKAGLSHKAIGLMEKSEFVRLLQDHRDGKL